MKENTKFGLIGLGNLKSETVKTLYKKEPGENMV